MSYKIPNSLAVITLSNIDGTSLATSTMGTTEGAGRFTPLYVSLQLQSTTGFVVAASLSIGTNGSVDNILPITALTGISSANLMINLPLVAIISTIGSSTAISVKVTTAATATTYLIKLSLIGFYS